MAGAGPKVGLAEVLRRHGPAYLQTHALSAAKLKFHESLNEFILRAKHLG